MFGCNRTYYMLKSIMRLLTIREQTQIRFKDIYIVSNEFMEQFVHLPLILSMDCHWEPLLKKLDILKNEGKISKIYDFQEITEYVSKINPTIPFHLRPYYRLSRNYQLALENIFNDYPNLEQLILVEDDLNYSDDFLEYFISLSPLLKKDKNTFCVCAWNDNAKDEFIDRSLQSSKLRRTDFFPGLGWMINKNIWNNELKSQWPAAFWDDWIRGKLSDRTCIQPIVSRSSTFGQKGASNGQFYNKHLKKIHVSKIYTPFYKMIDKYISELESFHKTELSIVYEKSIEIDASLFANNSKAGNLIKEQTYRIIYYTNYQFKHYTNYFELMSDFKSGIPRTSYKGIINFRYHGYNVYLAPPITRKIYIKSWN